jgi:hypothetical protein
LDKCGLFDYNRSMKKQLAKDRSQQPEADTSKEAVAKLPIKVTKLSDLQTYCERHITLELKFDETVFHIDARRLNPKEDAALDAILDTAIPPTLRGDKPENDRVSFNDPAYRKARAEVDLKARAMGLYWCVPVIHDAKPNLTKQEEILEHVQTTFNASILDVLWQAVRNGGVTMAALVNFTSSNTSQAS